MTQEFIMLTLKKGRVFYTSYELSVFDPVPSLAVETQSVSSESCSLLCSVDPAEETTLSWYKDEKIMNQSSPTVFLSVLKQDFNSSFRCVASNPAENKTLPVDVTMFCREKKSQGSDLIPIVISVGIVVVLVGLAACFIKCKYLNPKKTMSQAQVVDNDSDVQYTDVNICRRVQGENFPDSSETVDRPNLSTVYDQLEAHRMLPDPAQTT
ncbi:uncharacterized protein LOC125000770 [Mugil cephalus]|uniref:uncharacterized protein LOC125000770 n=1 Tax=Mugil cephalus TaxID=48193 RepID=UPI001FB8258A|nr:uncharacterized protein LOC125000770 [Mugil cephalus]